MRNLKVINFTKNHIDQAVALDKMWFGEYSASQDDFLKIFSTENKYALALVSGESLEGFVVFDILEERTEVPDYSGLVTNAKTAFIQQFTTQKNYSLKNYEQDKLLLSALETFAKDLECKVVWEALSKDHPFAIENNPKHDAYGFYKSEGYEILEEHKISWKQMIACTLLSKTLIRGTRTELAKLDAHF